MTRNELHGRVALVTGAGRGIGRAIALSLAAEGARVALVSRTPAELEAVCSEIEAAGGQALAAPADVSDAEQAPAAVETVVGRLDRLDILVNNAGIGVYGALEGFAADDWDRVMAANARSAFLMCRAAIPHLRKQSLSYIVNIASVVAVKGYANQAAYSASKHAMLGLSKALARELQADNIRVHAICPGGVDTSMASQARPDLDRSILIQPQEVADIVVFLVTRRGNAVIDQIDVRRATATPWG